MPAWPNWSTLRNWLNRAEDTDAEAIETGQSPGGQPRVRLNLNRRLMRLEARAAAVRATSSHSVLIHFVDSDRRVTSTLAMENGKQAWTYIDGEPEHACPERDQKIATDIR